MPLSAGVSFVIIFLVAATTFATRVVPFLIFPKGKEIPEVVRYLGRYACGILPAGDTCGRSAPWDSGSGCCLCDSGASCLEEK